MNKKLLFLIGITLMASACSSKLAVRDITKLEPQSTVVGLPFRVLEPYKVHLYVKDDKGNYQYFDSKNEIIANPERLYSVNFNSQLFSDHTLKVNFNENGTMSLVNLGTTSQVDEMLSELGTQFKDVTGTIQTIKAAKKAEDQAAIDLADANEIKATEARNAVKRAEEALVKVQNGTDFQISAAEDALRLAKIKANQAFRKYDGTTPYPDAKP